MEDKQFRYGYIIYITIWDGDQIILEINFYNPLDPIINPYRYLCLAQTRGGPYQYVIYTPL